ncbi:MAG: MFS transporter [Chloroflexi bacterium]|nr:MFS transporter [Chloroflexota bacterium]
MAEFVRTCFFYGYVIVAAAFIVWMMAWGTSNTYGVFFTPLLEEFGWSRATIAGGRSVASGVIGLVGLVAGGLSDRFGPRMVLLILGSFLGIGYMLMSRVESVWQFYLVYGVVAGAGMGAIAVPVMATIARWFVKRRGMMTGFMQAGSGLGGMLLSPLAAWLILGYDWRFAFLAFGLMALVLVAMGSLVFKRDPSEIGQLPYGADTAVAGGHAGHARGQGITLRESVRTSQFWMLGLMFLGFGFLRTTILVHIAPHANDLGFSLTQAASVLATMSGVGVISRIIIGRVADAVGYRRIFMGGYAVVAASALSLLGADEMWRLYLFAVAFGLSWGTLAVVRMPLLAEVFGVGSLGAILGAAEFAAEVGAVSGPFLAGWLFDVTGSYTPAFLSVAGAALLGLVMCWLLRPLAMKGAHD